MLQKLFTQEKPGKGWKYFWGTTYTKLCRISENGPTDRLLRDVDDDEPGKKQKTLDQQQQAPNPKHSLPT